MRREGGGVCLAWVVVVVGLGYSRGGGSEQ